MTYSGENQKNQTIELLKQQNEFEKPQGSNNYITADSYFEKNVFEDYIIYKNTSQTLLADKNTERIFLIELKVPKEVMNSTNERYNLSQTANSIVLGAATQDSINQLKGILKNIYDAEKDSVDSIEYLSLIHI